MNIKALIGEALLIVALVGIVFLALDRYAARNPKLTPLERGQYTWQQWVALMREKGASDEWMIYRIERAWRQFERTGDPVVRLPDYNL